MRRAGIAMAFGLLLSACGSPPPASVASSPGVEAAASPDAVMAPTPGAAEATTAGAAILASPTAAAQPRSSAPADVAHAVPVLMYHRVQPAAERPESVPYPDLYLEPALFREHVSALHAEGWRTVTARQVAEAFAAGAGVPAKSYVITVDDGYRDGYDYILPVLEEFDAVATFYVVPKRLERGQAFEPGHLVELAAAGNEIANHSWGHEDLAAMGPEAAQESVRKASDRIEEIVGARPITLAYPAGSYDGAAIEAVKAEGIVLAFTTAHGVVESSSELLAAPRIRVHADQSATSVVSAVIQSAGD